MFIKLVFIITFIKQKQNKCSDSFRDYLLKMQTQCKSVDKVCKICTFM